MKQRVFLLASLLVCLGFHIAVGKGTDTYALVEILFPKNPDITFLLECGIDPDHSLWRGNHAVITPLPANAIPRLRARGYTVQVWIADLTRYYQERNRNLPPIFLSKEDPQHFQLGSMGGFYRYDEVWSIFAQMVQNYPALIAGPDTIGWSIEHRPILVYRVGTDSAFARNVPQILYTAVHHAREPGGITTLVYFLWWLLEHYEQGDPEVQYLLNHRQLFIVPMVNPDGYVFNERSNPEGGGMWRKNRREVQPGIYGVDLNRNYGPEEFWDSPNGGSSDKPQSQTYRGTEPFSEPETQAMRSLCLSHNFTLAFNYHTYSNLYIYPWSSLSRETKDSLWFRSFARHISKDNHYCFGLDEQTVGYNARGTSDDWMYAELEQKASIFAITPEVGTIIDGFWPSKDRILPLARENLFANLQLLWSAAANLRPIALFPIDTLPQFCLVMQNIGRAALSDSTPISVDIQSTQQLLSSFTLRCPPLAPAAIWQDTLPLPNDPSLVPGDSLKILITTFQNGIPRKDSFWIRNPYGAYFQWLFHSAADTALWERTLWGTEIDPQRQLVLSDSPGSPYLNDTVATLRFKNPIDLTHTKGATLSFWSRWAIEPSFDFATVEISTDNGSSWHTLRSSRMDRALGMQWGKQNDSSQWGFEGFFPFWTYQWCDLTPYVGHTVQLRFRLQSDRFTAMDGWLLDDILLTAFPLTTPTTLPSAGSPSPTITVHDNKLFISNLPPHPHRLQLFSLSGKRLLTYSLSSSGRVIPLPPLPPGCYLVVLSPAAATYSRPMTQLIVIP